MNAQTDATNPSTSLDDRLGSLAANFKTVGEHLGTRAASLDDKASEVKTNAAASATAFISKADTMIKGHPIAALGIAFGVGYLFMRLIRR